jgi:hypothetical protein
VPVGAQCLGELVQPRVPEGILITGVDPYRQAQVGTGSAGRGLEHVISPEVRGVVERPRSRLGAGVPDGR